MKSFTYEDKDRKQQYEKYEWDDLWIDNADDLNRARVLYIGDSISCQTRRVVTELSEEKLLFDGFGTSKGIDNRFFKDALKIVFQMEERRDAVIFNNGLHGWHLEDDTEYRYHYEEMIKFLTEEFKSTPVFVVLTTVTAREDRNERIAVRNKVACEIAEKYGLPIIDLCTPVKNAPEMISKDGVHLTAEGYEVLADVILKSLKDLIPDAN